MIRAIFWLTFAVALSLGSRAYSADLNTTELDAAMETCRKHIVPDKGEYVFPKGWEECNAINAEWQAMRGVSPSDPSADRAKVHQYLLKRLQ